VQAPGSCYRGREHRPSWLFGPLWGNPTETSYPISAGREPRPGKPGARRRRFVLASPVSSGDAPFPVAIAPFADLDLATTPAVAAWLDLSVEELEWLADCESRELRRRPTACHYHYRVIVKPDGGERLIEAPKPRLKAAQRRVLDRLLDRVPPHEAAHGFVRDRSARTGARVHTQQAMVLRVDLRDFFASIPASRVHALLTTLGCSTAVARLVTGLCTNSTPRTAWGTPSRSLGAAALRERWHRVRRYAVPHLPAGAPTSPALANLACYRLDCRLSGLARKMGCRYTRYADDLTFSGDEALRRNARACFETICTIARESGFGVHPKKTRFMGASTRQVVTGLVVNARPNVPREEFDRLRAVLHNCARLGAASQTHEPLATFRARLEGRIAWCATNARRAERLQALLQRIDWSESPR